MGNTKRPSSILILDSRYTAETRPAQEFSQGHTERGCLERPKAIINNKINMLNQIWKAPSAFIANNLSGK
jgi:hypothetical protein